MEMVKSTLLTILCASMLSAAEFSLTIGNPIAANLARTKTASLAVRLENCPDLPHASLSGTAEGRAAGVRKSVPLQIVAASTPGVYAVADSGQVDGAWVANLKASCGTATAGAIVPFRGPYFLRESVKLFPRFATAAEVDSSLNSLTGGPK